MLCFFSFSNGLQNHGEISWWQRIVQAIPDFVVGLLGVPIAFSFQQVAQQPRLAPWRLFVDLFFLITLYLFLSWNFIDFVHDYIQKEHFHGAHRWFVWILRIGGTIGAVTSIVILAIYGSNIQYADLAICFSFLSVSLTALPTVLRGDFTTTRKEQFYLWGGLFILLLTPTMGRALHR